MPNRVGIDTQAGDDLETIRTRITEVIAWCAPRADTARPKDCFRSMELMPFPFAGGHRRAVHSVAIKRFHALGRPKPEPATDLAGGRLLLYEPDVNLFHGLEEIETSGYVDNDNTPPWDTWIAYLYEGEINYLLSWVPREFISLVTSGIQVSPEESFRWIDKQDLQWAGILRDHRLV